MRHLTVTLKPLIGTIKSAYVPSMVPTDSSVLRDCEIDGEALVGLDSHRVILRLPIRRCSARSTDEKPARLQAVDAAAVSPETS